MSPPADANNSSAEASVRDVNPALGAAAPKTELDDTDFPVIGELEKNGWKTTAVFTVTKRFAIYEADHQIRYKLAECYDVGKKMRTRIAELGGLWANIENLRADQVLPEKDRQRAARETAWALTLALEDEADTPSPIPKQILTQVDARLRNLVQSYHRAKYVFGNLAAFVAIEVALILTALFFAYVLQPHGNLGAAHRYALYGAAGGLGAFLSVIIGIRSINIDIGLGKWEHVFAGVTRIFIGVIGAFVVGLALDSAFIDPTLGNNAPSARMGDAAKATLDKMLALKLFFAFIAGFSESLVPNLLRRGEQAAGPADANRPAPSQAPVVPGTPPRGTG